MADFPAYARILLSGFGESFDPSIERTEMERGVPKERVLNSQVMMKLPATVLFQSPEDIASFEDWYFDTIGRIGWFQMRHPRTRQTITARFENASIGTLTPLSSGFYLASRNVTLEYLR